MYKRQFWMRMSRLGLLLILTVMFFSITAIHFISLALEVDPNWSITSAIQWCYGDYALHRLKDYSMFVPRSVLDLHHQQLLDPDDDLHGVGAGAGHRPHQPPDLGWSVHLARPGGGAPPLHGRVSLHLGHLQLSAAVPVQTW